MIRILLELDSSDEAIWTYFDSQHQYILSHMRKSHDQFAARANGEFAFAFIFLPLVRNLTRFSTALREKIPAEALEEKRLALDLQRSVLSLSGKDPDRILGERKLFIFVSRSLIILPLLHLSQKRAKDTKSGSRLSPSSRISRTSSFSLFPASGV